MEIVAKKIEYNTNAVTKKQFDEHLKLYKGYVDKTNSITKELDKNADRANANATYSKYRGFKKGETYALDGTILHEAYFQNMTSQPTTPCHKTMELLSRFFGNYQSWLDDFTACGKSARGWCILSYEQRTATMRNLLLDSHDDGVVCMAYPVLVLDMYEHAYFLDYGTDKEKYIKKFIESIDWNVVSKRISKLNTL